MPHLKYIGLTNFRVFSERTKIELAPLTILTGPNSSGKSSVLKAIQLLQENIADIGHLNFSQGEHKLGNFDMALNRNANDKTMVFTLPFEFQEMTEEMYMDWIYNIDTSNSLQYGKLTRLSVRLKKNNYEVIGIIPWEQININFDYFHRYRNLRHNIDLLEFYRYHYYKIKKGESDIKQTQYFFRIASVDFLLYSKDATKLIKQIHESTDEIEKQKLLRFLSLEFPIDYELFELSELFIDCSFGLNNKKPIFNFFDFDPENLQEHLVITNSNYWINIPSVLQEKNIMDHFRTLSSLYYSIEKEDFEHIEILKSSLSKNEEKILSYFKSKTDLLVYATSTLNIVKEKLKSKYHFTDNGELTKLFQDDFFEIEKSIFSCIHEKSYKSFMDTGLYENSLGGLLETLTSFSFISEFGDKLASRESILIDFLRIINDEDKYEILYLMIFNSIFPYNNRSFYGNNFIENKVISILKTAFGINEAKSKPFREFHKDSFYYLEAVRANTQRVYTWQSQGTAFNQLLLDFIKSNESWQFDFINYWIKEFAIGDEIKINLNEHSIGASISIDNKPLPDLGYGVTQFLPILIKIVTIVKYEYRQPDPWGENGWDFYERKTLYIEEPETNLHPKLQSKLADMFIDAYKKFNLQIIIETHSEYLIRKLQYLTAKKEITPAMTVIHYFYDPKEVRPEGEPQVKKINIQTDGRLTGQFGAGFYDETARLMTAILTGETLN